MSVCSGCGDLIDDETLTCACTRNRYIGDLELLDSDYDVDDDEVDDEEF